MPRGVVERKVVKGRHPWAGASEPVGVLGVPGGGAGSLEHMAEVLLVAGPIRC